MNCPLRNQSKSVADTDVQWIYTAESIWVPDPIGPSGPLVAVHCPSPTCLLRSEPEPQGERNQCHRADAAEPECREPQQALHKREADSDRVDI